MRLASGVVTFAMALGSCVPAAWAGPFDGEWMGGIRTSREWIFVQARFGGEGQEIAGRMDLPGNGIEAALLLDVEADDSRLSFALPGVGGEPLQFRGTLNDDGRVSGAVREGNASGKFELLRVPRLTRHALAAMGGAFEGSSPGDAVLLYLAPSGLCYVDYRTGRIGRLFPLDETRLVSGQTVTSGYPIALTVALDRDLEGKVIGLEWQQDGEASRRLVRREHYRIDDVRFESSGGTTLVGTLLVPNRPGPHAAVVMIYGSGRTTRDALLPLAHRFASEGVAVLLHDKRGVGESSGDYSRAGLDELADDALSAVELLKQHPAVDVNRIGLLGTSLGGWVAPLAAARSADVKFVVVESAPAIKPAEHERRRVRSQMLADGFPLPTVMRAIGFMDRKFRVGQTGEGWDDLVKTMEQGRQEGWLHYANPSTTLESLRWNWDHVLSYDPQPALGQLTVPLLALYGELDRIVDPGVNQDVLRKALELAGNRDVTIRTFAAANHSFLSAGTGGPAEMSRLSAVVPGYFEASIEWVLSRFATIVPAPPVTTRALPSNTTSPAPGPSHSGFVVLSAPTDPGGAATSIGLAPGATNRAAETYPWSM